MITQITRLKVLCFIISLFLIIGCKKNSSSPSNTKEKWLTAGLWTLQKFEYKQLDGSWGPDPDAQDMDHITFTCNTDKTATLVHGSSTITAHWQLSSDFSQLTFTAANGNAVVYSITAFSQLTLQMIPSDDPSERETYVR